VEDLQKLLDARIQDKIKALPGRLNAIYDELTRALKSSNFDKDMLPFKFASTEKRLIGEETRSIAQWFMDAVKVAALEAGKSEQEAQIFWSSVYCLLPSPLPVVKYIDVSAIDVAQGSQEAQSQNNGTRGSIDAGDVLSTLGVGTLLAALSSLLTDKPAGKILSFAGGAIGGHVTYNKIKEKLESSMVPSPVPDEAPELVLDEEKLSWICAARAGEMMKCFATWLSQGQKAVEKAARNDRQ